jgi:hypothetical protein
MSRADVGGQSGYRLRRWLRRFRCGVTCRLRRCPRGPGASLLLDMLRLVISDARVGRVGGLLASRGVGCIYALF